MQRRQQQTRGPLCMLRYPEASKQLVTGRHDKRRVYQSSVDHDVDIEKQSPIPMTTTKDTPGFADVMIFCAFAVSYTTGFLC